MGLIRRIKIRRAIKRIMKEHRELLNRLGSDYDSNGHAYWDYDWHTNDPADDWRLIDKSSIGTIHTDGEVDPSMKNGWISE
jgi:hypothetical protein